MFGRTIPSAHQALFDTFLATRRAQFGDMRMEGGEGAPPATPAAPAAPATAPAFQAPATSTGPAKGGDSDKLFTEEQVKEMMRERVARIKGGEEADARFTELENSVKSAQELLKKAEERAQKAEERAVQAAVTGLLSDFHPGADKFLDLDGVTSDNVAEKVGPQIEALKTSHPFLVKAPEAGSAQGAGTPAPVPSVPGAAGQPANTAQTVAGSVDPKELAKDPEKFKRYLESLDAQAGVA